MKNYVKLAALPVLLALFAWGCSDVATVAVDSGADSASKTLGNGNGLPSGPHYQFNMIGVPKDKNPDMTNNKGRRIFVPLQGKTKINLSEGDYQVLDANGTDGEAAFQLPNPDPDCDGVTDYSVYVRALGKPGGSAVIQSCYTDASTGEDYCADDVDGGIESITVGRTKGKQTFTNVSRELLYVDYCASWSDSDGDGVLDTCDRWTISPLFADDLADYFWDVDNDGLRNAQFRFYEVETDIIEDGDDLFCP